MIMGQMDLVNSTSVVRPEWLENSVNANTKGRLGKSKRGSVPA